MELTTRGLMTLELAEETTGAAWELTASSALFEEFEEAGGGTAPLAELELDDSPEVGVCR